jgi:hypothetical protein
MASIKDKRGPSSVIIMSITQLDIKQHKKAFEGTIVFNKYDIIDNGHSIKFLHVLLNFDSRVNLHYNS